MLKNLNDTLNKINLEVHTMDGLVNSIYENPERFKDKGKDPEEMFKYFGILSLSYFQMKSLVDSVKKLKQMCLDEIDGKYFEKHEAEYFDMYEDVKKEDCTIYNNVLLNINEGTYNITKAIEYIVCLIDKKDLAMNQAFNKFFPSVPKYKEKNGEMVEVDNNEVESVILSKAYSIQNYILDDHSNLVEKIKNICEKKGNVGKIIEIIEGKQ